ncbi:MAG: hypothetical protein U0Q18_23455 [Bryobacteraceae bacterium]
MRRVIACFGLMAGCMAAADFPSTTISNGLIRAKVYLPDAKAGFYRASRFDWSGAIGSLEYKGHNYYGPWFKRVDPNVHDFGYDGEDVIASPCAGDSGPVEEFQTNGSALGWDEAKPGGTFIKIGVGVLRKDSAKYDFVKLYRMVDPGKWSVRTHPDSVEFTQELSDPSTGYAYVYQKTVRLLSGKPEMVLEHQLKNTGRRAIRSSVYNHNFLVLDEQPVGPDFAVTLPFEVRTDGPRANGFLEAVGNRIKYLKKLAPHDVASMAIGGFGPNAADNEIRIENRKAGAGVRITGDHPLTREYLWSIKTVLSIEPTISMDIAPGGEFHWKMSYEYYLTKPE